MKHLLLTTIAAVLLVGCGPSLDIWEAARTGNVEAVKQHLAAGVDVNAKTDIGSTPLHLAAIWGRKEIVGLLVASGADVNAIDKPGRTPLDEAINYKRTVIAELLRKHGGKTGEELKAEDK
ncbi:MAG TPA: ankyrin repeat domain-containing protein [Verrucomicrobia bacterium]|nr:ankyrin repeat domain-containing protein [Verrucomicrobiota bacterium]